MAMKRSEKASLPITINIHGKPLKLIVNKHNSIDGFNCDFEFNGKRYIASIKDCYDFHYSSTEAVMWRIDPDADNFAKHSKEIAVKNYNINSPQMLADFVEDYFRDNEC